ncbi:hypothetical protein V8G54_023591 [Vigna mungo]|uniref:Secretory carrier-associated membrane protein n=1 Tax=Vigna mungo TaxID=3915 RepID=A0AAQ3N5H3_VIGMU
MDRLKEKGQVMMEVVKLYTNGNSVSMEVFMGMMIGTNFVREREFNIQPHLGMEIFTSLHESDDLWMKVLDLRMGFRFFMKGIRVHWMGALEDSQEAQESCSVISNEPMMRTMKQQGFVDNHNGPISSVRITRYILGSREVKRQLLRSLSVETEKNLFHIKFALGVKKQRLPSFLGRYLKVFLNSGSVPSANSKLSPLPPEPYDRGANIDIPLDNSKDTKAKEKELKAREADLKRREQELKRREDAIARAGIVIEEKNWPPFFPIIHHDIGKEIPIHLQRTQYIAFSTWLDFRGRLFIGCLNIAVGCVFCDGTQSLCWVQSGHGNPVLNPDFLFSLVWFCVLYGILWQLLLLGSKEKVQPSGFLRLYIVFLVFQDPMCCGIALFIVL